RVPRAPLRDGRVRARDGRPGGVAVACRATRAPAPGRGGGGLSPGGSLPGGRRGLEPRRAAHSRFPVHRREETSSTVTRPKSLPQEFLTYVATAAISSSLNRLPKAGM